MEANQPVCNDEETVNPDPLVRNEEVTPNLEVNPSIIDSIPSPPPSHNTTLTPITIDPCSPPVTSSQATTVPHINTYLNKFHYHTH